MTISLSGAIGVGGGLILPSFDFNVNGQIGPTNSNLVALDAAGNVYVTGVFSGQVDFDPARSGGAWVRDAGSTNDIFVAKYSPTGAPQWVSQFTDSDSSPGNRNRSYGIAVTPDGGSVYVTGTIDSLVDFNPDPNRSNTPQDLDFADTADAFVVKLDTGGRYVWEKTLTDGDWSLGYGIAVDRSNANVYVTGERQVGDFDGFVDRLNATTSEVTFNQSLFDLGLGGFGDDRGRSVAVDNFGNILVTGSINDPGNGDFDSFIVKLNPLNDDPVIWSEEFQGPDDDEGVGIGVDSSNNVYAVGNFSGDVNFNPDANYTLSSLGGTRDVYVVKLNQSGTFQWARRFGSDTTDGNGVSDEAKGIAVTSDGTTYVVAQYVATAEFADITNTLGTVNPLGAHSGIDIAVLQISNNGGLVDKLTGGSTDGDDEPMGIAATSAGKIAMVGNYTNEAKFGATSLPVIGASNMFVVTPGGANRPPDTGGDNGGNGGGNDGGRGGGSNGKGTSTSAPVLVGTVPTFTGKGKHRSLASAQILFSGGLDAGTAQDVGSYRVTQKVNRRKTRSIAVRAAIYNPGNNSVTLLLAKTKKGKPVQVVVSGLHGSGGAPLATAVLNF